ncbi:hypothetical protein FQP88_09090 [Vibrio atlanticus]|nr:hypothetical protein FQP88_09090 [Vibrio atlanticus]
MDKPENLALEAEQQASSATTDELDYQAGFADLDSMDSVAHGEPEQTAEPEQEAETMDSAAAVGMVSMGLFMSEQYISGAAGVDFEFNPEAKAKFLEASGPLIEKYGLTWLSWFDAYKEEIFFGVAAFGLGYSSINTVKRLKALQEKEAENDGETQEAAA